MSTSISSLKIEAMHVNKTVTFNCALLSIKQTFNPNWNSEAAYGKMDNIAIYANTTRAVDFSFTSLGKQESSAIALKRSVEDLVQMQYPLYTGADQGKALQAPPFFKITSLNGKMYNSFEGYIQSIDVTPGSNNGTTPLVTEGNTFVERRYDISLGFVVMHAEQPGFVDINNFSNGKDFYFASTEDQPNNPRPSAGSVSTLANTAGSTANDTFASLRDKLGNVLDLLEN